MTPALVPELLVSNLQSSLSFWCGLIGFKIDYDRPEEKFAYLACGDAHVMLEQYEADGDFWVTDALQPPFGRGINFEIGVDGLDAPLQRLNEAGWPLYREPYEAWYRKDSTLLGQRQFLVQDPDGYLLRLCESIGSKPVS